MNKAFVRNLDSFGRITLPKELCNGLHIGPESPVNIKRVQAGILIAPLNAACGICGSTINLLELDGIGICRSCAERLREKL